MPNQSRRKPIYQTAAPPLPLDGPDDAGDLTYADKLFNAADLLRGAVAAYDYKYIVLGLIFLKYVSDAFEDRHAALERMLRDERSEYYVEGAFVGVGLAVAARVREGRIRPRRTHGVTRHHSVVGAYGIRPAIAVRAYAAWDGAGHGKPVGRRGVWHTPASRPRRYTMRRASK